MPRTGPRAGTSQRDYIKSHAHDLTHKAIKDGKLPDLSKIWVKCSDCEARAIDWDHRDYRRPLDVAPVCRGCNIRRGPALPAITDKDETTYKLNWFKGTAGKGWSAMRGEAEGFSPLESLCHISTKEAEAAQEQFEYQNCYDLYKAVHIALGRDPVSLQRQRDEYFKAHDPWR